MRDCRALTRARDRDTKSRPHHEGSRRYSRATAQLHGSDIGATAGRHEHFQKMAYMDQCTCGAFRAQARGLARRRSRRLPGCETRTPRIAARERPREGRWLGLPAPLCRLRRTAACGAPRGVRRARAVWHSSRRVGWLGFRLPDPGFDPMARQDACRTAPDEVRCGKLT